MGAAAIGLDAQKLESRVTPGILRAYALEWCEAKPAARYRRLLATMVLDVLRDIMAVKPHHLAWASRAYTPGNQRYNRKVDRARKVLRQARDSLAWLEAEPTGTGPGVWARQAAEHLGLNLNYMRAKTRRLAKARGVVGRDK